MTNGQFLRPDMFNEILRHSDINATISQRRCRITRPLNLTEEPKVKIEELYYTSAWVFQCILLCFTVY